MEWLDRIIIRAFSALFMLKLIILFYLWGVFKIFFLLSKSYTQHNVRISNKFLYIFFFLYFFHSSSFLPCHLKCMYYTAPHWISSRIIWWHHFTHRWTRWFNWWFYGSTYPSRIYWILVCDNHSENIHFIHSLSSSSVTRHKCLCSFCMRWVGWHKT